MKAKVRKREKQHPYWTAHGDVDEKSQGLYANHGCTCSCWMCGNPRKHLKERTIQEKKSSDKFEDGLNFIE